MAARRNAGAATGRDSRVRSRQGEAAEQPAAAAAEGGGLGFTDALILGTTVLLLAAFVMMDKVIGVHFGGGLFFGN
jgi:hypothetical protein